VTSLVKLCAINRFFLILPQKSSDFTKQTIYITVILTWSTIWISSEPHWTPWFFQQSIAIIESHVNYPTIECDIFTKRLNRVQPPLFFKSNTPWQSHYSSFKNSWSYKHQCKSGRCLHLTSAFILFLNLGVLLYMVWLRDWGMFTGQNFSGLV